MKKIGGPQVTLLASDHPKTAHSSTLGPFFTPNIVLCSPHCRASIFYPPLQNAACKIHSRPLEGHLKATVMVQELIRTSQLH
eukprot:1154368-Pelagomonas_calceolata.AAC.1